MKATLAQRFSIKYAPETSGCWIWTAGKTSAGYGAFWDGTRQCLAHRWIFEQENGPIGEGLQVDHTCNNRECVNPAHLSAVTPSANMLAAHSDTEAKRNAARTHCPSGHEYSDGNTYLYRGARHCRTCRRAHNVRWRREGTATEVVEVWEVQQ